jgi:hypothetical protein
MAVASRRARAARPTRRRPVTTAPTRAVPVRLRLRTADCRLPTATAARPTADCRLFIRGSALRALFGVPVSAAPAAVSTGRDPRFGAPGQVLIRDAARAVRGGFTCSRLTSPRDQGDGRPPPPGSRWCSPASVSSIPVGLVVRRISRLRSTQPGS